MAQQPQQTIESPAPLAPDCFVFDACAFIAYFNNETGADKAEQLFERARAGGAQLFATSINVYEVYYDALRHGSHEKSDNFLFNNKERNMKLLVVDDEQDVQLLFQQRFRQELKAGRIEFQFAFSGEQALEFLENRGTANHVLILSDINMPGMTGIELLQRIKEKFPQLKVILITAYGDDNNYHAAMANGADGYTTKPINFDALKQTIFAL
ncbi:MAG: response regulator [bacterium]